MAARSGSKQTTDSQARAKEIIRKRRKSPMFLYYFEERIERLVHAPGFVDGILAVLTFLAACAALRFYPLVIIIPLAVVLFSVTVRKPFLGLIVLIVAMFPMFVYQMPALAWLFLLVAAGSLIYGYMYHRVLLFLYVIVAATFSPVGYIATIPLLITAVLMIGYKRAMILTVLFIIAAVSLSAVTNVQNFSYIVYNAANAHNILISQSLNQFVVPNKPGFSIFNFSSNLGGIFSAFSSEQVITITTSISSSVVNAMFVTPGYYLVEAAVILLLVFGIDSMASNSRTRFRGLQASFLGVGYPLVAVALSISAGQHLPYVLLASGFLIAPIFIFMMEGFGIKIVNALDIRKQDLRMKFGEAFEDLETGNVAETFDDVANYAATKRELIDAVLGPIEERAVSKAYNIKPAKGILFFGPPGTGKTLMMRALANEVHAGFFYVKAPNLISAFPGETEKMISNIFSIAKKNAPCVLFFDEIDSIAPSREKFVSGDTGRQALSQLLVEMDGFQKTNNVIMVGATNAPNLLDPAVMRPGRFDKIIYLPPPDYNARKQIFDLYLKKLPVSNEIDLDKIAEETERYTGADIKVLCETVAQRVAQVAVAKHNVLEITEQDIMNRISVTKPSITLAQIEMYQKFRLDFERSVYGQKGEESKDEEIGLRDVVGMDDAKKILTDAIEMPLMHPELIKKYKIKSINGILIFGPPGTGKTMLIRAIKTEMAGITMVEINGAELADQGIERATATIKDIFDRAKSNAPSLILLDEVEELLLKRGSATEYSAQITSEMLREIDGISKMANVVVIGTTNRPDAIDVAALRPGRFDKIVFVRPPGKEQRATLFRYNLKEVPISDDIDYDALAEGAKGYTGADIYHVCREAKTIALDKSLKGGKEANIEMQDLIDIMQKIKPSASEQVMSQYLAFYSKFGER